MDFSNYNEIVQQWIDGVLSNSNTDAELTLKYCNDIIDYGLKLDDPKLVGFGYFHIAQVYYSLNDGNQFFENISKSLSYLEKAKQWEYVAKAYNILGITALNRGNAPIAFDYYLNGITYCRKYNLPDIEVILNINCGVLNIQTGQYDDALQFLDKAYKYMYNRTEEPNYHSYMICIYQNIAICNVKRGQYNEVDEIFRTISKKHWPHADYIDRLGVLCAEAFYYHKTGQTELRDDCIAQIDCGISENIAIMDMFDDFYMYSEILLECDKNDELWHFLEIIEPMIRSFNITYMQMMEISLKIKYYKKNKKHAEYLQAAGLYYELSEKQRQETQSMINNVLLLRRRLETANRMRREVEEQNQILEHRSEHDPLTKLPNRFKLNDFADKAFTRAKENQTAFAIEILDIDYFKEFNDNYGHQKGDVCLAGVADAISSMVDEYGVFGARYGGDEFVLIYENVTMEQAERFADELKKKVMELNMEHKYSKALPIVTISQGVCHGYPKEGEKVSDYLHVADEMLYRMKKKTRNNYCVGNY